MQGVDMETAILRASREGLGAPVVTAGDVLRFDSFELHPLERRLLVRGQPTVVGSRAFDLLVALAEKGGEMVTKDQLLDRVWPKVVVAENNLHVHVSALRKLLGTHAIGTLPGRGYRLAARRLNGQLCGDVPAGEGAGACLPPRPGEMFGRTDELAMLAQLLGAHRLVSIVGPGGVGKSMLAVVAARACDDPVQSTRWVDLHALAGAEQLPRAVARALGAADLPQPGVPDLVRALRGTPTTLVLDGAEHLLDAVAQVVESVLEDAPDVQLLVTSRSALQLDGERVLRLDPLPVPAADANAELAADHATVALFASEAQAADQRFVLTDANVDTVVDVCRKLDGLPLAIKLAAQRAHVLGLPTLRAHLPDQLHLLRNASRGAPERHGSLVASFEWSVRLLDDTQRTVLRRLGTFDGAFSLDLATEVAAGSDLDPWIAVEAIAALVDRSLVQLDAQALNGYRLLTSMRCFVRRLADPGMNQNDSAAP